MPVVPCPHCTNPVTLPPTWGGAAYTCPHCRRVAGGSPLPRPVAPPPPVPVPPPPPTLSFNDDNNFDNDPSPPRRRPSTGSPVADFLTFRLMITPIIIQIIFWFGVAGCVIQGGLLIVASFNVPRSSFDRDLIDPDKVEKVEKTADKKAKAAPATQFSPLLFLGGVSVLIFGPLLIRILCELDIILFKIHDELKAANDRRGRT